MSYIFKSNIKQLMDDKGVSIYWMHLNGGINEGTVRHYQNKKPLRRIDAGVVKKFMDILDVQSMDELFTITEED